MNTIKIVTVVGAKPQFIKAATVSRTVSIFNEKTIDLKIDEKIVHAGQHYDENMSKTFFDELQIPRPFANLEVG
jgi:UDP-GlcNAc3NAcA epimerase